MREISTLQIKEKIKEMFVDMNYELEEEVSCALLNAKAKEESPLGKEVLEKLLQNLEISKDKRIPICQDTGMAVIFIEIGQQVILKDMYIEEAINQGVREAYEEGYLRKSVVKSPLVRENTKDNTPAIIHYEMVEGDKVTIKATAKGFGSENMGQLKMLTPSEGRAGVVNFVVETISKAGSNPCPPIVVGVGMGGTMEKSALLAKKALLRPLEDKNTDPYIQELEVEILEKINALGIGPQGFGGRTTALAVNIESFPTHIAGLPVTVNINCHVSRHRDCIL